jgi:hypothetical protein
MTGTKLSPTVPNLLSNDEITRFDGFLLERKKTKNVTKIMFEDVFH